MPPGHVRAVGAAPGCSIRRAIPYIAIIDRGIQQQARECYLQERGEWLADEAWMIRSMGLAVTTEVVWTRQMLNEILLRVTEMQPDLLIKDGGCGYA
jgi:hypothetical protein